MRAYHVLFSCTFFCCINRRQGEREQAEKFTLRHSKCAISFRLLHVVLANYIVKSNAHQLNFICTKYAIYEKFNAHASANNKRRQVGVCHAFVWMSLAIKNSSTKIDSVI